MPVFEDRRPLVRRGAYTGLLVGTLVLAGGVGAARERAQIKTTGLASHCSAPSDLPGGASTSEVSGDDITRTLTYYACGGGVTFGDGTEGLFSVATCASGEGRCLDDVSEDKAVRGAQMLGVTYSVTHLGGSRTRVTWDSNGSTHCTVFVYETVGNDAVQVTDDGADYDC